MVRVRCSLPYRRLCPTCRLTVESVTLASCSRGWTSKWPPPTLALRPRRLAHALSGMPMGGARWDAVPLIGQMCLAGRRHFDVAVIWRPLRNVPPVVCTKLCFSPDPQKNHRTKFSRLYELHLRPRDKGAVSSPSL